MRYSIAAIFVLFFLSAACQNKTNKGKGDPKTKSRSFFAKLDPNYSSDSLILPKDLKYDILFQQGDLVKLATGQQVPVRGKHDLLIYLPINGSSEHGWLWVNHEDRTPNMLLGDGGGASMIEVKKENGRWKTLQKEHVDFSPVGGTAVNCLGEVTPWGTILTSEEWEPRNNLHAMYLGGISDTSDYNGWPRFLNYGWMVEVDPNTKKAIRKLWGLGRFMHEGVYLMPDNKTVYLMDDAAPGAFFKFVADQEKDLTKGQLYAYKQSRDGESGEWIPLPMTRAALNRARAEAFRRGATIFIRFEDMIPLEDGTFIITETGLDLTDFRYAKAIGGKAARHLSYFRVGADTNLHADYYGRLLRYDPKTEKISVLMEGGQSWEDQSKHFSNPDNMALNKEKNMVVIHEDINGFNRGRMPRQKFTGIVNEVWTLDLNIPDPSLNDLQRLAIGPKGCETTGGTWTPDGKTFFMNIQHPSPLNSPPFNRATTVAITGF